MKPPKTMPLPWNVAGGYREGFFVSAIFDEKNNTFKVNGKDRDMAAAYIQHCVNVYPVLVAALKLFIEAENCNGWRDLKSDCIERIAFDAAQEALRKAGE